jgi:hypothetical protein
MTLVLLLQQAADVAGEASKVGDGAILTAILALTSTIFGALTLTQKSQVDGLKQIIADCRSGRDEDIKYERQARTAAETKEDKCLDRMSVAVTSVSDLSTAVRENATIGTAIVRTQDTMARDITETKKVLDELRRAMDDLRYRRGAGGSGGPTD